MHAHTTFSTRQMCTARVLTHGSSHFQANTHFLIPHVHTGLLVDDFEIPPFKYTLFEAYILHLCTPTQHMAFALASAGRRLGHSPVHINTFFPFAGLLVDDFENPSALAEQLRRAATDPELRARLSANARESAFFPFPALISCILRFAPTRTHHTFHTPNVHITGPLKNAPPYTPTHTFSCPMCPQAYLLTTLRIPRPWRSRSGGPPQTLSCARGFLPTRASRPSSTPRTAWTPSRHSCTGWS